MALVPAPSSSLVAERDPSSFACLQVVPRPGQTLMQGLMLSLMVLLICLSSQKVAVLVAFGSDLRKPELVALSGFSLC